MAIRGRPTGGPSGFGQTVGHAPNARHRSSLAVYLRLQWARPSLWCRVLATAFRPRSGAAPPGSWRLSRRDAVVRAAPCWRRLRRPSGYRFPGFWVVLQDNVPEFDAPSGSWRLSRRDAVVRAAPCWRRLRRPSGYRFPGFWVVLQDNVPEFDAPSGSWRLSRRDAMVRAVLCWRRLRRLPRRRPPGSGRLFRFLAAIRVDGYGITPGQKHSHRRCPVPQPTKPPRPLLVR